ncbi:ATP-binding protein [Streptomyces sp. NPDC058045]|uniref:ATP-binding protein n=1 Tax=Streptomyces sp. NPDC058045 TaxID=3346311 RepID=UPI0036EFB908
MWPPLTLELLATPKSVPEVRQALRAHLGAECPDLQLCASELLGNVILHVGEGVPVTVRLSCAGDRTRLEVSDPDPRALPVLRGAVGEDDESGRGLVLLDALTLRWGVEQRDGGKTVWCETEAVSGGEGGVVGDWPQVDCWRPPLDTGPVRLVR